MQIINWMALSEEAKAACRTMTAAKDPDIDTECAFAVLEGAAVKAYGYFAPAEEKRTFCLRAFVAEAAGAELLAAMENVARARGGLKMTVLPGVDAASVLVSAGYEGEPKAKML